jgi:hypothetical protein
MATPEALYAFRPAQTGQSLTALFVCPELLNQRHQINRRGSHTVTAMPKKSKHTIEMTSDELAKHVFHPKVLKAAKEHIARLNAPKSPMKSTRKRVK